MVTGREFIKIATGFTKSRAGAEKLAREFGLTAHPDQKLSSQKVQKLTKEFARVAEAKGIKIQKSGRDEYGFKQALTQRLSTERPPLAKPTKKTSSTTEYFKKVHAQAEPIVPGQNQVQPKSQPQILSALYTTKIPAPNQNRPEPIAPDIG